MTGLGAVVSCTDGFGHFPAATYNTSGGVPTVACNLTLSPNFIFSGCARGGGSAAKRTTFLYDDTALFRDHLPQKEMQQQRQQQFDLMAVWSSQAQEERTAHLLRHVGKKDRGRRLQWRLWQNTSQQARDNATHDATRAMVVESGTPCSDSLASNIGLSAGCAYDCDTLQQAYFPNHTQMTRCFLYNESTRAWPAELLAMRQYNNTVTIPNNENWIVHGNVDPTTGLPVSLDARLSSGTPLNRSHANIVVRFVRFTGQTAPIADQSRLIGHGIWWADQGSYGGAFRYEGGSSDHENPVRLTFDHAVFDHNAAHAGGGGAVAINGRAGLNSSDSSAQNWDSAIAANWSSCVFFRNFGGERGGALLATNVWPMTFAFTDSTFIQNQAGNAGAHDGYYWDSLVGLGHDVRQGFTSLVYTRTSYDGGSGEGLVSSNMILTNFYIDGTSPDEPNATWNVTLTNVTYENHSTRVLCPGIGFQNYPIKQHKLFQLNVHIQGLIMTDLVNTRQYELYDSITLAIQNNQGVHSLARMRFERNGCINCGGKAKGIGGMLVSALAAREAKSAVPLTVIKNSTWQDNVAGYGAAIYVNFDAEVHIKNCVFRGNVATRAGGAIYFAGALNVSLHVQDSIFAANAVRPAQDTHAPATIVIYTGNTGEGSGSTLRPVWRIDDRPVHGIGWDVCQAVMQQSQESVQAGWDPWIPTGSQNVSSCANDSYKLDTTYSTTEMLAPGKHTLWHGMVTESVLAFAVLSVGWIK